MRSLLSIVVLAAAAAGCATLPPPAPRPPAEAAASADATRAWFVVEQGEGRHKIVYCETPGGPALADQLCRAWDVPR